MPSAQRVTDFTLSVMRITPADYRKLTASQHELLRFYSSRSWEERDGTYCFEVASYRVEEILAAGR